MLYLFYKFGFIFVLFLFKGMNPKTLNRTEQGAEVSSDEETALYHQEFVSDPEYTVGEILQLAGWKVHAFLRFECGEE